MRAFESLDVAARLELPTDVGEECVEGLSHDGLEPASESGQHQYRRIAFPEQSEERLLAHPNGGNHVRILLRPLGQREIRAHDGVLEFREERAFGAQFVG